MENNVQNSNPLVAINGYAGSGKSTVAKAFIIDGFHVDKFARPLKAAARGWFRAMGLDSAAIARMIEGDLKEAPQLELGGKTPREFMQWLGGDARKKIFDGIHTRVVDDKMRRRIAPFVIDDLRYQNELDTIRALGGVVIKVVRPGVGPVNGHESENEIGDVDCDIIIYNNRDLDWLNIMADEAVREAVLIWQQKNGGS